MSLIGYVDNAEALTYIQQRYDVTITQTELDRALYQAFDKIELINVRYSRKEENSSNNNFPRTCENEVPANVKQAQMLEAYEIATGKDKDVQAINKGIKSRGISDMSYSYEKALKVGDTTFSNIQAAKIMQMYERKTFGQRINNGY
ncbi:DnaT-like ssDNA-binding protein [uncultured Ilyobacter sp.]|uniref:DnaT-like ssDNA-binding protein n=1 Tax=uncultured Ilyobacter sp. TaxID=544433 RepID=UPI0029C806C6|nr:DnaT-like ssDNA-binding protein [uncultured Ilyobacter sp.]